MKGSIAMAALSAAACGLGWPVAAAAQSDGSVSLYGLLDVSAGRFQDAGAPKAWQTENGKMSQSFLGFKGVEELGGGLKAKFAIESYLRADTGASGRAGGDAFWGRNAYVGLQGEFGSTVLGRTMNLLYVSTLRFNALGESFGFSPAIRQVFAPAPSMLPFYGDIAWNNSVHYASPDADGVSFNIQANLGEGAPGAVEKNLGANLFYTAGPLAATLVHQRVRNNNGNPFATPAGFSGQNTWQVGLSYDLAVLKLYGQYTQVQTRATVDTKTAIYGLGAAMPLAGGTLLAQYGHANADFGAAERTQKTLTLGYDLPLSKRTDVYALLMSDRITNLANGTSVAGGMRVRF